MTTISLAPAFRPIDLTLRDVRFYIFALVFVLGNLALPAIFHQFNMAGPRFLPIYFFVLIGAYKYGWKVGILTAIASPILSHFITGMPPIPMLQSIFIKGVLLAIGAAYIARMNQKISLINLILIVLFYQIVGSGIDMLLRDTRFLQDMQIGYPGMLFQIFGGYITLLLLEKYAK